MILVLRLALVAAIGLVCARHAEAADLTPPHYSAVGLASWYGSDFHGHATADGEIFDMGALSAAHRSLPLPCYARVTNLGNGRSIVVRVNDRGPFVGGRILDVSARVAKLLEFNGLTKIRVDYVGKAPPAGSDGPMLLASLQTGSAPAAAPPSPPAGFDLPALLAHLSGAPAVAQPVPVGLSQAAPPPSAADEGVTAAARVVELRKAPDKDAPAAAPPSPPAGFDLAALLASVHSGGAPALAQPAPVEVSSAAQPSAPDEGVTVAARVVEHRTKSDKGGATTARLVERRKAPDKGVVVAMRVVERPQAPDKGVTVAARVVEPPALAARPAFGNAKIVLAGVVGPPPVAKPLSPFGDLLASPFLAQTARP
jgi:rare lipoprotein A (peptidoglycan hydrolase)